MNYSASLRTKEAANAFQAYLHVVPGTCLGDEVVVLSFCPKLPPPWSLFLPHAHSSPFALVAIVKAHNDVTAWFHAPGI